LHPTLENWIGAVVPRSAGVISGILSDRSLPITATFLVRAVVWQRLCRWIFGEVRRA